MPSASDRIVLTLILAEIRASIRSARRRDLAWAVFGGLPMAAYAIGIVVRGINYRTEMLNAQPLLWWLAIPAAILATGAAAGASMAILTQARAHVPFLKAQPLSEKARWRMAAYAALVLGSPLALIVGGLTAIGVTAASHPPVAAWGIGATIVWFAGYFAGMSFRLHSPYRAPADALAATSGESERGISIAWTDRRRPMWIGSWAANFATGRFRFTTRAALLWLALALAGTLAAVASIVRGNAAPAVLGGVLGGFAIFMLALRCGPLLSPVLRASQLSFTRAMRGLVRLPLLLSLLFFGALAVPAYAAEPGMIAMPVSGLLGLLALNAIYAVFAAFFAHSRRLAGMAFFAALSLAAYELLEYSRTILVGLAALVVFLWMRARGAYRHG